MFGGLGWPEALVVVAIALVIFGPGKIPQAGKALGEGIRNFRKATGSKEEEPQKTESDTSISESSSTISESDSKSNDSSPGN
ncbi:MAG: twin-arginine translocase TatA/TatE family subunit [Carboxydocellales bacterium]|jgi:TatA/E family protein of Tat protein translocase